VIASLESGGDITSRFQNALVNAGGPLWARPEGTRAGARGANGKLYTLFDPRLVESTFSRQLASSPTVMDRGVALYTSGTSNRLWLSGSAFPDPDPLDMGMDVLPH